MPDKRTDRQPCPPGTEQENWDKALDRIERARAGQDTGLDLSGLGLTAIPDALGQLANLQVLYLDHNQIAAIPDALGQLANLQVLYLDNNQIAAIPDVLGQLGNLQRLDLANNQIAAIPDALGQLANLQRLDLDNNQIAAIPDALNRLTKLTHLFLHGNPGLGLSEEVLGPLDYINPKPPHEILTYYFAQRDNPRPLNEAKLILVGEGGVGKSSLVEAIRTGEFIPNKPPTEGIKIDDWTCHLTPNDPVNIHVWDFGGQELMHATHQFFLTKRSLYLLVLNDRNDRAEKEADYWLRLIRAFGGPDAPVIIALNRQIATPFDLNRGDWLKPYEANIKAIVKTDCEDPASIAALKEQVRAAFAALPSVKDNFPGRWFRIKDAMSQMQTDYVTFADYRAKCGELGEEDAENQSMLAGYLNDLGIALSYRDDPRLRFAYVLKPEWVTNGIYTLLHALREAKGLFTADEAAAILAAKGYSREAAEFIQALMEKFELCFSLGDPARRMLIPQLLDDLQPAAAGEFQPELCLNFGYEYSVAPKGLLPRFITRTHYWSDAAHRWKSGVIVEREGARALVRVDSTKEQVKIHVAGSAPARDTLLAVIRSNFEFIHSDLKIQPANLVYPPGHPDTKIPVRELNALQASGIQTRATVLPDDTVIQPRVEDLAKDAQPLPPRLRVFISYSHKDGDGVEALETILKPLERLGLIEPWRDNRILAGTEWEPELLNKLDDSDVVICQLTMNYRASDYCVKEFERAAGHGADVLIVPFMLHKTETDYPVGIGSLQMLTGTTPVEHWKDGEHAYWNAIYQGLEKALRARQKEIAQHGPRGRRRWEARS